MDRKELLEKLSLWVALSSDERMTCTMARSLTLDQLKCSYAIRDEHFASLGCHIPMLHCMAKALTDSELAEFFVNRKPWNRSL